MKIREAKKGLRVTIKPSVRKRLEGTYAEFWRTRGTLTSGRVVRNQPEYGEGLHVRVKWDGMPTPENWDLAELDLLVAQPLAPREG